MIEHFEKFKLTPLSFSHLNEFAFYRARWALRKIFKYDFTVGPAAERGTVIETGLNMWFNGRDLAEIEKKIIVQYLYNTRHVEKIKRDKEQRMILPLLHDFINYFDKLDLKLISYQDEVKTKINNVPFRGFTDFHFEDFEKQDLYIDLKTTGKLVDTIPMSHAMQQSIYAKATNARQQLLYGIFYVTKDNIIKPLEVDNYAKYVKIAEHLVLAMGNYLKTVNSLEDIQKTIIPDIEHWSMQDEDVKKARIDVWGY